MTARLWPGGVFVYDLKSSIGKNASIFKPFCFYPKNASVQVIFLVSFRVLKGSLKMQYNFRTFF